MELKAEYPPNQESKMHDCFFTNLTKESGSTYSDLTGRYLITSSRGNH